MRSTRKRRPTPRKRKASPRWRQRAEPKHPSVVIIGFGRMGGAMALGLKAAGWPVSVLPRSPEAVRRTVSMGLPLADHDSLRRADLCVLAVSDGALPEATALIEEDLGAGTALVHCSGALRLTAFGTPLDSKRKLASFHPLAAISDPHDSLAGHSVAVSTNSKELLPVLWRMALALELTPLEVPETGRAAYHAGAVLSAGLAVGLLDAAIAALEHAGLEREQAIKALVPLTLGAIKGAASRGVEKALTGPVVRGDVSVVQAHLEALPPELGSLYRLLSRRALKLAQSRLPAETRLALERILA